VTNDGSTATDGTATQNNKATQTAKKVLAGNQQAVSTYLEEKGKYEATVKQATALNKAVESAFEQLKKEKVDVKVVTRTVSSVAEVEALQKQNEQAIATAKGKVELNKALLDAWKFVYCMVDFKQSGMVCFKVRTDFRIHTAGAFAVLACPLIPACHAVHVGRRPAEVGQVAFEIGHFHHLLHLLQDAFL